MDLFQKRSDRFPFLPFDLLNLIQIGQPAQRRVGNIGIPITGKNKVRIQGCAEDQVGLQTADLTEGDRQAIRLYQIRLEIVKREGKVLFDKPRDAFVLRPPMFGIEKVGAVKNKSAPGRQHALGDGSDGNELLTWPAGFDE